MNNWLNERSKLFAKYAESMPRKFDKIELKLDHPDCGWIDMHFNVNGVEKTFIELSAVYEPFMDIKKWLENITVNQSKFNYGPNMVDIDCEGYHVYLYYEPIVWAPELICGNHHTYYGLFYIYETLHNQISLEAFCNTWEFVNTFYHSIINYAKEMQGYEKFIDDWVWDAYNSEMDEYDEDSPELKELFINKIKSETIVEYINKFKD